MKKLLLFSLLAATCGTIQAQITTSITIPNPLPNYDGTYDDFGQGHLFYSSGGEVRFADKNQGDASNIAKYYTMNTYPKQYLLNNNNIALCYAKCDLSGQQIAVGAPDTLQRIDLEWSKSNPNAFLAKVDTQNYAKLNYFTQWFNSSGRTNIKGSAAIACQSIYKNIDLVYTSNNAGLVMYFIVYPGGDYKDILMHVNGSKSNSIVGNKLKLDANWESTTLEKPQMYQYIINNSTNVASPINVCNASWQTIGGDSYQIGTTTSYNASLPLIIQLKQANTTQVTSNSGLTWSTYFGGWQYDFLTKTHCDGYGNLFVAGYSNSTSQFPQGPGVAVNTNNNGDGVIVGFNNSGKILWSTFVGGSSIEEIRDFDFRGNYVTCVGKTGSNDLQVRPKAGAAIDSTYNGGNWDGFIFELSFNATSNTVQKNWLTYFGGNNDEELNACKYNSQGEFFTVGAGASSNMTLVGPAGSYQQTFNSAQLSSTTPLSTDGIIAKFTNSGLLNWFTFYGTDSLGTNSNNYAADYFYGISVFGSEVYACGKAGGSNLPHRYNAKLVSGDFDGVLVHFSSLGKMNTTDAKYTDGNLVNYAVKVLFDGVYTVGQANSSMSPLNSGLYYYSGSASGTYDACFSMHSSDLSTTIHNSFLGGSIDEAAYDIQITSSNLILIAGGTNSSDFPTNSIGAMYIHGATNLNDNFIACVEKNNTNLKWSTYLGSDWQESLQYPGGINFQYNIANTTISLDYNNVNILGSTTSYNTFPHEPWTGSPVYYQPQKNSNLANDATITRLDLNLMTASVGIKDFKNTEFVYGIYPNPTARIISITNKELANDDLRFIIYDMSGKKLKAGSFKASDNKDIDVSFLTQGIYIINVSNSQKTFSNKFVKVEN